MASLNYALSFCLIQFTHGTLATKQPAMTAAAMAGKLKHARHRGRLREFVDEVAHLTRSQVAAIFGNLAVVAPAALVVGMLWEFAGGATVPAPAKAEATVQSLSIIGATPVYAAFTGVLLWVSAVLSGWVENWATFRRLPEAIAQQPRLVYAFGAERMEQVAGWFEQNVAGLGGNLALGVLLGMVPVAAAFFGLPLDVRHVTLSTGSLALAVHTLGPAIMLSGSFWLAVAGIAAIGVLNLGVSFSLALWVAIRSTGARELSRRRVYRVVTARFLSTPRDFLLPPRRP
jgi:site-specific recombinase